MSIKNLLTFNIPERWGKREIGDIITLEYGDGLPKRDRDSDGDIPVYGSSGITGHHSESLIDEPCLIVGRKGSIGATYISNEPCWPIDTTYYIIPPEELKLEFLYYYLFVLQTERLDKSTSIPSLSRDDVYEIEMGIPPLREQELIVSKIEELFSQIDVATSEVKETKEKLTNYKIALHEAATTGQLTSEWRTHDDTSATERIEQIEKERYEKWEHYEREKKKKRGENVETDRWKKKYDSPAELPVDDLPDLPESWTWTTLDTVTAYDVDYRGKTPPYSDSGIPVISSGNIQEGEVVIDNPKYVTEETYEEWLTRGVPEPGDLLITTEAPPGDTALFPDDQRYLPTRRIITFKTVGVDNRYLQLCFNNSRVEEYIAHNSRGTTVDRILKDTLFETPIPLPPLSEQEKIVSEVERNNTVIKNGMETIKDVLHRAENMKQSILAKAFRGELVQPPEEDIKHKHNSTEPTAQTEQITLQDLDNV